MFLFFFPIFSTVSWKCQEWAFHSLFPNLKSSWALKANCIPNRHHSSTLEILPIEALVDLAPRCIQLWAVLQRKEEIENKTPNSPEAALCPCRTPAEALKLERKHIKSYAEPQLIKSDETSFLFPKCTTKLGI